MNIYLIRHGETDWNLQGKLQGREDIPLNNNGILQAKLCGRALKNSGIKIKSIITSPLLRAKETAQILGSTLAIERILVEEALIERDFGDLSGLVYDKKKHYDTFGTEEGIEPFEELCSRLINCLKSYTEDEYGDDIIMVSHGAAINAVIAYLTEGKMGSGKTRLKNTSINKITYKNDQLELELLNVSPDELIHKVK